MLAESSVGRHRPVKLAAIGGVDQLGEQRNAAILAGQDAATDGDLDRKLQAISDGIDLAEATSTRLRETLKSFA